MLPRAEITSAQKQRGGAYITSRAVVSAAGHSRTLMDKHIIDGHLYRQPYLRLDYLVSRGLFTFILHPQFFLVLFYRVIRPEHTSLSLLLFCSRSCSSANPTEGKESIMCPPERDLDKIAKGWTIAMLYSKERLKRVYDWEEEKLESACREGRLVLETVCLFVHSCVKHGQYQCVAETLFLYKFEI